MLRQASEHDAESGQPCHHYQAAFAVHKLGMALCADFLERLACGLCVLVSTVMCTKHLDPMLKAQDWVNMWRLLRGFVHVNMTLYVVQQNVSCITGMI